MAKLTTVVISRKQWLRGGFAGKKNLIVKDIYGEIDEDNYDPALYSSETRTMCCLGFVSRVAKLKIKDICDLLTPSQVYLKAKKEAVPELIRPLLSYKDGIVKNDSKICSRMMAVNDNQSVKARDRESKLKKYARKIGIQFKFVA